MTGEGLIPAHGGFRKLKSFQVAQLAYDLTVRFCDRHPEIAANAALVLLAVACSLLDRQLAAQAAAFEQEGGFTERLYRTRTRVRAQADPPPPPKASPPSTPSTRSTPSSSRNRS